MLAEFAAGVTGALAVLLATTGTVPPVLGAARAVVGDTVLISDSGVALPAVAAAAAGPLASGVCPPVEITAGAAGADIDALGTLLALNTAGAGASTFGTAAAGRLDGSAARAAGGVGVDLGQNTKAATASAATAAATMTPVLLRATAGVAVGAG